jgi:SNF2 family DNA or RNA helicase
MRNVLIVCPQVVASSWQRTCRLAEENSLTPWEHQAKAAAWLAERNYGALFLDMATGKSLTVLLALGLVGRPLAFTDLCRGAAAARVKNFRNGLLRSSDRRPFVGVINYDSVWRASIAAEIGKVRWDAIILDESHRIKSPFGRASKFLRRLALSQPDSKRVLMTGTPMPHSPLDIWSQFLFLDHGLMPTPYTSFRARYADCDRMFPSVVRKWKNQDELASLIDQHAWRVMVDDVLDLPETIHQVVPVELSPATRRAYDSLATEMTCSIDDGTTTAGNALTKILRLQQATGGHATLDGTREIVTIDGTPGKATTLAEILQDLAETEPVVVIARFRADLDAIAATARQLGRPYSEVSGERKDLEAWQAGNTTIIGVQIQSGGAGIDLSRAAYCIYYSLTHSLGDYEQSLARLRRPGQTRCVRYYHLCARDTIDETIYKALRNRRDVIEAVMSRLSPRRGVA